VIIGIDCAICASRRSSRKGISKRGPVCFAAYISRVENGHTVPAIETLEKLARAMEIPMYQLFYDGDEPPKLPPLPKRKSSMISLGAVRGRMHAISASFGGCWQGRKTEIAN